MIRRAGVALRAQKIAIDIHVPGTVGHLQRIKTVAIGARVSVVGPAAGIEVDVCDGMVSAVADKARNLESGRRCGKIGDCVVVRDVNSLALHAEVTGLVEAVKSPAAYPDVPRSVDHVHVVMTGEVRHPVGIVICAVDGRVGVNSQVGNGDSA